MTWICLGSDGFLKNSSQGKDSPRSSIWCFLKRVNEFGFSSSVNRLIGRWQRLGKRILTNSSPYFHETSSLFFIQISAEESTLPCNGCIPHHVIGDKFSWRQEVCHHLLRGKLSEKYFHCATPTPVLMLQRCFYFWGQLEPPRADGSTIAGSGGVLHN